MTLVVNLGVEDFGDFKFRFIVNNDWRGWGLNSIGDRIRSCWFQHGDVENRVYSSETVRKLEGDRMGARECKDFDGPRNLSDSFFEGRVVWKN